MATKALAGFSFENIAGFGEVLHAKFVKELNAGKTSTTSTIEDTPENWKLIRELINKIYTSLGLEAYKDLKETLDALPRIGDVVEIDDNRTYVITGLGSVTRTFPAYIHDDAEKLDPRHIGGNIIKRPSLSLLAVDKKKEYEKLVTEILQDAGLNEEVKKSPGYVKAVTLPEDSTHLQIGDLIFAIDPIQLSFTTQNGYQYYPTLRTNGNPKIPSLQQIKNISISLIFPNVDSINYQLIPLFAMFKRTPFVNIKNRDLTRFYKQIASPQGYVSVALESIQIQSIEGFPNSAQANITLLPFETGNMGEGSLKALKSFDDVFIQQERIDTDAILNKFLETSEDKIQDQTLLPSRFKDMVTSVSEYTENFKESLPFRVFYQSLIAEHKYVREEDGSPAKVYSGNDLNKDISQDLSFLAPTNRSNLLHHYTVDGNRKPLQLTYKYSVIEDKNKKESTELRDIGKYLSEERLDKNSERLNQLEALSDKFKQYMAAEWKGLPLVMFSAFGDLKEAIRPYEYQFNKLDNIINQILLQHNIEPKIINSETNKEVGLLQVLSFIWRSITPGISQIASTWQTIQNLPQAEYNKAAGDMWSVINANGLTYIDANNKDVSAFGIHTLENAFKSIWDWINKDPGRRTNMFLAVLADIANGIERNLLEATVVLEEGAESADTIYAVRRLPIRSETITIDNVHDVITAWSLIYNNKFVPISLLAYKYPFYQHLGSEDISFSLSIVSVPSEKKSDLKSELSVLSDRLYDSVKLVMFTSPELITWMDPRIELKFAAGSIFHAFGLEKAVLNSSNSTNIQGQPDSWNTVVNFTQANFSLEQYHSLSRTPTNAELDGLLANLIPRIKIVGDDVKVMAFKSPKGPLSLSDLLFVSFITSAAGDRYLTYIDSVLNRSGQEKTHLTDEQMDELRRTGKTTLNATQKRELNGLNPTPYTKKQLAAVGDTATVNSALYGTNLLKILSEKLKDYIELEDVDKEDERATSALRTLMLENRKFSKLVKGIVNEYNSLLERQADAFINLIGQYSDDTKLFYRYIERLLKTKGITILNGLALVLTFALIPGLSWATGARILLAGLTLDMSANIKLPKQIEKIKNGMGSILENIISVYHKEMLISLSNVILKDPPIRKRLLSKDIISVLYPSKISSDQKENIPDIDALIEQSLNYKRVNCYQDFDIPLTWSKDNRIYRASPDFYLYNPLDPKYYITSYIRDSLTRLMKVGRMGVQLSLVERTELLNKFDKLLVSFSDKNKNVQSVLDSIGEELGYKESLDKSLIEIAKLYRQSALTDTPIKVSDGQTQTPITITDAQKRDIIDQFKKANAKLEQSDPKLFNYQLTALETVLDLNVIPKIEDAELKKLNIIWTARMKTLLELTEMAAAIQTYFAKKTLLGENISTKDEPKSLASLFKANFSIDNKDQLSGYSLSKVEKIRDIIWAVLDNWKDVKTDTLASKSTSANQKLAPLKSALGQGGDPNRDQVYDKGMYHANFNDKLSLPAIRILEAEIYNKIGYYIRLNSAIDKYNATGVVSLDELPELAFLSAYNVRTTESTIRQIEIEKQLIESMSRQQNLTLRLFPTYKIYFIEEDKGTSSLLDDYYSYNAVQSIEISKNKDSASSVAVIRLSNLTGTITDKLSFHREASDFSNRNNPFNEDEAFFGTLDVKPGTRIQIKMGYASDERYLNTVFSGRIIEMNVGPTTEIICQSYSAQLNHMVYQEKFGFFASEKEYGDIASALLDMIPGLENLGKKEIISFGLSAGFSGREIKKIRENLFNNFLLSSILGRITADLNAVDNPRDENIYLPFNLSFYPESKPRFDWVVYNQTVWEAIQEICLYSNNATAVIKQYNNDPLSRRSEQRETIVIGNKSGYYKFTDSLSLSSIGTEEIETKVNQLIEIASSPAFKAAGGTGKLVPKTREKGLEKFYKGKNTPKPVQEPRGEAESLYWEYVYAQLKPEFLPLWNYLSDPINVNIIKKKILTSVDLTVENPTDAIQQFLKKYKLFGSDLEKAITYLERFASGAPILDPINSNILNTEKGEAFIYAATFMVEFPFWIYPKINKNNPTVWTNLTPEEFYSIRGTVYNTDPNLAADIRYKKIQQHHLISDATNLISNQIALNSQFPNMVNLYYTDEPMFIDGLSSVEPDKFDKLNVWPIKAFGAIKDEQIIALNTYQKNIDPYYIDIIEAQEGFYTGAKRLSLRDKNNVEKKGGAAAPNKPNQAVAGYIQSKYPEWGAFNLNIPDWRAYPSYQMVGVNLLKKEVSKMYRGTIQIIGDTSIEPLDIIHLEDYVNDIHGVVEVDEVVHTFTPDRGLITTITPCLLTYDRDPIQMEDTAIINRIYDVAQAHFNTSVRKAIIGSAMVAGGVILATKGNQPFLGGSMAGIGLFTGLSGFNAIIGNRYHKFLYDNMGNILGRDVINFTALLYHGLPYMCGFDGVDYTNLKTLINHKVRNVEGPIARLSAFSDPFAAAIYTNFKPEDFGVIKATLNKAGLLKMFTNLPTHGNLNDAMTFWDRLNPFGQIQ